MKLFFDTETTGMANFKLPPNDPSQPRLVQLAAILEDNSGKELCSMNLIVKPEGFEIPAEASNIHGITTEEAQQFGQDRLSVLNMFYSLVCMAELMVGHNISYDLFIIRGELMRVPVRPYSDVDMTFIFKQKFCTMLKSTNIVKLPSTSGRGGYKWPKLQEAYEFAFGKKFEGAHDAMADIRATKELYYWINSQNKEGSC